MSNITAIFDIDGTVFRDSLLLQNLENVLTTTYSLKTQKTKSRMSKNNGKIVNLITTIICTQPLTPTLNT